MKISNSLLLTAMLYSQSTLAVSPSWSSYISPKGEDVYQVTQFLPQEGGSGVVVLNGGKNSGLLRGALLETYRVARQSKAESHEPLWIKTGALKITQLQEKIAIASVVEDQTEMSRTFFPKFPNLMAGDLVIFKTVTLARKQSILPQVMLTYGDLFIDPRSHPQTFELKKEAVALIKERLAGFAESRAPLLMIEGYTDHNGAQADNQVESYQRAQTIRQYLIDELGFDENRVVAIGYGESEQADASMKPGYTQVNRRIVIKALSENL